MHSPRVLTLVACVIAVTAAHAQPDGERASLTGIGPVGVLVEELDPEHERDGLTVELLRTGVESRLRQHGILLGEPFVNPTLYVSVDAVRWLAEPSYVYSANLEVRQIVQIRATKRVVYGATTWNHGVIGTIQASRLRDIRETVLDLVDEFSEDYLAVNPPAR